MCPTIRAQVVKPHSPSCAALPEADAGASDSPWKITGELFYKDVAGPAGRRRFTTWIMARCNDPSCPAIAIVDCSDILKHIPRDKP